MNRHRALQRLIKATGVSIIKTSGFVACYDIASNTIELPRRWGAVIRGLFRPTYQNFSLAHELGHAILAVFDFDEEDVSDFYRLFGDVSEEYDRYAYLKSAFISRPKGFLTSYASFHPEEDFADTLAFVLTAPHGGGYFSDRSVKEKIEFAEKIIFKIIKD